MSPPSPDGADRQSRLTPFNLVGPFVAGLGIWCAAGVITVARPDSPTVRLAVPPAWWWLPLAVVAAALVPGWRRRPLLAVPALLATWPWWPVPLPRIALMWTGPMAWVPIGFAVAAAIGTRPVVALGRVLRADDCRRSALLAGAATMLAGLLVAANVEPHVPAGDEPHYLVITQSLLYDHDLRIENNHRRRDYAAYFGGDLRPDYLARGRDGQIYSIHAPGLPAIVLPAFALFGYRGVEAMLMLFAGLTGSLVWRTAWRATGDVRAAWFAWAAIVGSTTFLLHTFAVFPDGPGAFVAAASVLLLVRIRLTPGEVGTRALTIVSALLAVLPWLHTRFVVLAAGFGLLVVWCLLTDDSRSIGGRRNRAALFLVIPCVSALAWFGFFQVIYGTPNPAAPYGGGEGTRAAYIPGGLAGVLFDEQFGLLPYAPVLALGLAGLRRASFPRIRRVAIGTAAVAAVYLMTVATYWLWWAGSPANPARFVVAVLPVWAIPLATRWRDADVVRRRMMLVLLGVSLAISSVVIGFDRGDLAWNMRNAETQWLVWLGPVVNLSRGWPSFFWALDPAVLRSELPFALHAAVWVGTFVAGWLVLKKVGGSRHWTAETWRAALCGWMLAAVMVATELGWSVNHVDGLSPAQSQIAVLTARRPIVEIATFRVEQVASVDRRMSIPSEDVGRTDAPPPWLVLESVPAGTYEVHVSTSRPRAGDLLVTIGRGTPIQRLSLLPQNRQSFTVNLPAGAVGLTIAPSENDANLEAVDGRIELEPVRTIADADRARTAMTSGPARIFFLDDGAFVEPEGFWVRGGQSTRVAIESMHQPPDGQVHLVLQNGRAPNAIVLDTGSIHLQEQLGGFETREIGVPAGDPPGAVRLTIVSPSGFRPSDDGASQDSRYLGVRVTIK